MPRVMDLTQGTKDWLEWREKGIGSSDAAAILGLSPWATPFQLWNAKARKPDEAGRSGPTKAMQRGIDLEPHARQEVEWVLGQTFNPICLVHDEHTFLKASLDGLSEDGKAILEIKCPGKKAHQLALQGQVPDYYTPQLDHQFLVSAAELAWYASYDPDRDEDIGAQALARLATQGVQVHFNGQLVLIPVYPDHAALEALLEAELEFWDRVQRDDPPALTLNDMTVDYSEEWAEAALEYRHLHQQIAGLETQLKDVGARLKAMAGERPTMGAGVKVVTFRRSGTLDYKKAAEDLADVIGEEVEWEKYRKGESAVSRITVEAA